MKYRIILSTFLVCMCVLFACTETSTEATNEAVENVELSAKQVELVTKMRETSLLLTDIVKRPDIVKELKYAADFSLKHGRDEDVYFSELFRDNAPYKTMGKTKSNVRFGAFKEQFREQLSIRAKANSSSIDPNLEEYLIEHNLKLYWPYSENWDDDVTPTLSYHPLDNEDENEGFRPIEGTSEYELITMNDEYAMSNPSLLLVPCEEDIFVIVQPDECGGGSGGGGGWNPPSPPEPTGENPSTPCNGNIAKKILVKSARVTRQYDGLFGGGTEVYWHSANAVLMTPNDTEPLLQPIKIPYTFSRQDISNGRWKAVNSIFDDDWSSYELSRQFHIIEGDGDPRFKKFGIKVEIPKVGGVGFEVENFEAEDRMDSRRKTLYDNFLTRSIFFVDNTIDDGNGFRDGVKIRAADRLYWTATITDICY